MVLFSCVAVYLPAQEVKENLELTQTTLVGDSLLLTGFETGSDNLKFVAVLYDKQLKELARYKKTINPGAKSYFVERVENTFRFTFYSSTNKVKHRLNTDLELHELYSGVPEEKELAENVDYLEEWTYAADYCNDYVYGKMMLNAQLDGITCYTILDPLDGTYRMKWEKEFSQAYNKVELIDIVGTTAYYSLISISLGNAQEVLAIDLITGVEKFKQQLNGRVKTDSVMTMGVSCLYSDGKKLYLAGTYLLDDPGNPYPYTVFSDGQSRSRGYDGIDFYVMYMADGYFIMTLDAASGEIGEVKLMEFPSVDNTVDRRDYRVAVCPGIAPLKDGKMVAFFEQLSCVSTVVGNYNPSRSMGFGDEMNPKSIKWVLDAFTSVVFDAGLSDVTTTTTLWEDDYTSYVLTDFDMLALNVHTEHPRDYVTVGEDGTYPHEFVCDGTNWTFVIRCDDEKSPDYLLKANESEQKIVKLINAGIVYMLNPNTAVEQKTTDNSISLKVVKH